MTGEEKGKNNNIYALILAGGSGSRLWPLSREMYPKQLQNFNNDEKCETLLQNTFKRLTLNVDDKNILTITNIKHQSAVKSQLEPYKQKYFRDNDYKIITEPISKNTAAAITLGVKYICKFLSRKTQDPIVFVTASDNTIEDIKSFASTFNKAIELASDGNIVMFGTKPKKADEGLGYIKVKNNKQLSQQIENAKKVAEFVEKPDIETCNELIQDKNCYVNSGMYMFKASVFKAEMKKHSNEIFDTIEKAQIEENNSPNIQYNIFENLPNISIDYALIEKSKKTVMLELECDWMDLGSWEAIYEHSKKDENNNCCLGNVIDIDSKNSFVYATSKLVTTIGLNNVCIVETEDALLVCDKSKSNEVKKIYEKLKDINDETHKVHKTVYRPWGYYSVLQEGEGFLTKCICVNPHAKLSLQYHFHRSEHWVVLEGNAIVMKDNVAHNLTPGESIDIQIKETHSLENPTDKPLKILEVQKGDILDENDIVRLSDMYGRV